MNPSTETNQQAEVCRGAFCTAKEGPPEKDSSAVKLVVPSASARPVRRAQSICWSKKSYLGRGEGWDTKQTRINGGAKVTRRHIELKEARKAVMLFSLIYACCLLTVIYSFGQHSDVQQTPAQALKSLEDEFWEWRMSDAPLFSTASGETRYNDRLESFLPSVYSTRKTVVENFLSRLENIACGQLNKVEQLDYDIFNDLLQTFLDGAQWNSTYFPLNPITFLEGDNADPGFLQTIVTFNTTEDFENYLQRLTLLPGQIDEKIELMKMAVTLNHTLHNVSVADVPDQIDRIVQKSVEESDYYQPAFTSALNDSDLTDHQKTSLRERAQEAVRNINQALLRQKTYLEDHYMDATRPTFGIRGWEDSRDIYQQCLKYHTSTSMTPQEVHDLGLREVERIKTNMQAALNRLQFSGSIKAFFNHVKEDPQFHPNSSQELLDTYEDFIFNRVTPKVNNPAIFKDIPNLPLKVESMAFDGPGGMYMAGTPDGSIPGIFFANVNHPEEISTLGIMALVLHEAIPGHHLQGIYSLTSSIPKYRAFVEDNHYYRMPATFPINTAYLEGWALYAEYLGEELGLYSDDYMLMGRYSSEIFRACRLVVDTGLHYFKWDRERAIQYMLDNTDMGLSEVTIEIDRYVTWPGQATAYKIGELKIKELRQRATQALGPSFQLADFHNVVLKNGGMPLYLLERLVDQWIAQVKATQDVTPCTSNPENIVG